LRILLPVVAVLAVAAPLVFGAASAVAQEPDVVTYIAEGPSAAHPGDTVSYRLDYTIEGGPGTDVRLAWTPGKAGYVSTTVISGQVPLCYEPPVGATVGQVRCSLAAGSGTLEVALQIPLDVTSGALTFGGSEPGTAVPGLRPLAASNAVTTLITPAAPPDTGSGSLASDGRLIPSWLVALLVAGGVGGIGAAARMAASVRSG